MRSYSALQLLTGIQRVHCRQLSLWDCATSSQALSATATPENSESSTQHTPQRTDEPAEVSKVEPTQLFKKLLIANRGEIACRIAASARRLGVSTVAVYSETDRGSQHIRHADESFLLGPAPARDSYLRIDKLIDTALRSGAQAIHPGYGFLSESAAFADACAAAGLVFVGPPGAAIRAMGDKARSKTIMSAAGVPVVQGYHGEDQEEERLMTEALRVGFPLLVKAVSGGGGKGMKIALRPEELQGAIRSARREATASFGDDRLLLERYITRPRHIEVQVLADKEHNALYLFDRDCSVQRRHQKVLEEAPAPGLSPQFHRLLGEAAVRAAQAVGYVNAGTVEFIVDMEGAQAGGGGDAANPTDFYFMEMNTRLQVEHPVTEAVAGLDLVEWQLRVASGSALPTTQAALNARGAQGHALEARLYAEMPRNNFLPSGGLVRRWQVPRGAGAFDPSASLRVDSAVQAGDSVGTFYDPMIAKVIVHAKDRAAAIRQLSDALAHTQVSGLPTNVAFVRRCLAHAEFQRPECLDTSFIPRNQEQLLAPQPLPTEVVAVAAVAKHLLKVEAQAAANQAAGAPPLGPWDLGDSKRLWYHASYKVPLMHADGASGGGSMLAELRCLSRDSFQVRAVAGSAGIPASAAATDPASGPTGHSRRAAAAAVDSSEWLQVQHATLDAASGRVTAEVGGRRCCADVQAYVDAGSEVLELWMDAEHYTLRTPVPVWSKEAAPPGAGAQAGAAGGVAVHTRGTVCAPMPGRVVLLPVRVGDKVSAGAPLVMLEAMKMEHAVVAQHAGVVSKVHVVSGAQVSLGQALVVVIP